MNLISCDNCGVVLDKNKLNFPDTILNDDSSVDVTACIWNGEDYVKYVNCPCCGRPVLSDEY